MTPNPTKQKEFSKPTPDILDIMPEILDIAKNPVHLDAALDARIQRWEKDGYDLSQYRYGVPIQIITMDGSPTGYRMDFLSRLIKSPLFKYDVQNNPPLLMGILATSSYWLRDGLFEKEAYTWDSRNADSTGERGSLIRMLDVAYLLMEKSFSTDLDLSNSPSVTRGYEEFFLDQARKRSRFLNQYEDKQTFLPLPIEVTQKDCENITEAIKIRNLRSHILSIPSVSVSLPQREA